MSAVEAATVSKRCPGLLSDLSAFAERRRVTPSLGFRRFRLLSTTTQLAPSILQGMQGTPCRATSHLIFRPRHPSHACGALRLTGCPGRPSWKWSCNSVACPCTSVLAAPLLIDESNCVDRLPLSIMSIAHVPWRMFLTSAIDRLPKQPWICRDIQRASTCG
jgi:hypothetical protein